MAAAAQQAAKEKTYRELLQQRKDVIVIRFIDALYRAISIIYKVIWINYWF